MRIYIPTIGERLQLLSPWEFRLYDEYRNQKMIKLSGWKIPPGAHWREPTPEYQQWFHENHVQGDTLASTLITLPVDTILSISRIYIRQGASAFDSVTFILNPGANKKLTGKPTGARFWVKLRDVNTMECAALGRPMSPPVRVGIPCTT